MLAVRPRALAAPALLWLAFCGPLTAQFETAAVLRAIRDPAVQEFRLETNNFSAEFGRAAGAVINAAIRSGTNEFHGSLMPEGQRRAERWLNPETVQMPTDPSRPFGNAGRNVAPAEQDEPGRAERQPVPFGLRHDHDAGAAGARDPVCAAAGLLTARGGRAC